MYDWGIGVANFKDQIRNYSAQRDAVQEDLKELEKSLRLDLLMEKEAIRFYLEDLRSLFQIGRKTAPEEMRDILKYFIRVEVLIPSENERAVSFNLFEEHCRFIESRSAQT